MKSSLLLLGSMTLSLSVAAQNLDPVIDKSSKINESAAQSQQKVDQLADQIDSKLQQFKNLNKEIEGLKIYNLQLQKQIENQVIEMGEINSSIDQVSIVERQITPLMLKMIDFLDQFVSNDIPFQMAEREQRVARLKTTMDAADVSASEKFRQVFEAYQIELDYSRTLNAYEDLQSVEGVEQPVNFLRVGRVALIYQTKDRKHQALWDQNTRDWVELGGEYSTKIANGIKMAREQMAPDMLVLPIFSAAN